MTRIPKVALAAALALAVMTQSGCLLRRERIEESSSTRTLERSVPLEGAIEGDVVLEMSAGELRVTGGAGEGRLLDGEFLYSGAPLSPSIDATTAGDRSSVDIRNEGFEDANGIEFLRRPNLVSEWDIRLTEAVPIRMLSVSLGAGDSDVDLSSVEVERLRVNLGAGDAMIDLSGDRTGDVDGTIQAGAGTVRLVLPADVGVRVHGAADGVGEWKAPGFRRDGNYFVNDAYETSDVRIDLDVQRGVGEVRLELVD